MSTIIRHGDVLLVPVSEVPKGETKKHTSFVAQEGEVTGHKHLVSTKTGSFAVTHSAGVRYFTFSSPATITHEEHLPITILPGTYRQEQELEKDWFSEVVRQVID